MRLLIPLIAGMTFFVAPQAWVELSDQGKYSEGFIHFWLHDYAEFGASRGTPLPTWNHLWFVAYLWVYSMTLAFAASLPSRLRTALQECFDGLFSGWRLYMMPISLMFVVREAVFPVFGETHALVDDPYAHLLYGFAFFFGVGLARSPTIWKAITKHWKLLLAGAGFSAVLTLGIKLIGLDSTGTDLVRAASRALLAWTAILGLLGMAQLHLHYDGPIRRYLTEAIFPYYIAHQTIIIVVGYQLKQMAVAPIAEFIGLLLATLIGCALTYEAGRRIRFLRPVIGLKALPTSTRKLYAQLHGSAEP
jgi:surface polysaccharide O-acyltransferase-like enzyme